MRPHKWQLKHNVVSPSLNLTMRKLSIKKTHFHDFLFGVENMFLELEICQHMQCRGSEVLKQSRALAHKSSLTDLHIACELTASRDSGTDASQANAAFTAGSVTKQHGACSCASPTSGGWIIPCCNTVGETMTLFLKVAGRVFRSFSVCSVIFCEPSVEQECAPLHRCWPGCACRRTKETSVWVSEGGWGRHATVRPCRSWWSTKGYLI